MKVRRSLWFGLGLIGLMAVLSVLGPFHFVLDDRGQARIQPPLLAGNQCSMANRSVRSCVLKDDMVILPIGWSLAHEKCVTMETPVVCARNAGDPSKRVNEDFRGRPDSFNITVGDGLVCARRRDLIKGWDMNLQIVCQVDSAQGSDGINAATSVVDYTYTVCNGMASQLLTHAGHIATAITAQKLVRIPDVFIVDGTHWQNTKPTLENSIHFHAVFDPVALLRKIESYGIRAELIPYEQAIREHQLECSSLDDLQGASPAIYTDILKSMVPSQTSQKFLDTKQHDILSQLGKFSGSAAKLEHGVCFHPLSSHDGNYKYDLWKWFKGLLKAKTKDSCRREQPISELVWDRISHLHSPWILYIGEAGSESAASSLGRSLGVPLLTFNSLPSLTPGSLASFTSRDPSSFNKEAKDLAAALDLLMCSRLPNFVGNSVSAWSDVQIFQRSTMASWYTPRGIPLATRSLNAYPIPIVYTYTEASPLLGKLFLQISILSVKRHVPFSSIHVLYNGRNDVNFTNWLSQHGVTLHDHEPAWRDEIERLRHAGSLFKSHLYGIAGSYLGTWQRIDIPSYVSTEYCILLDSDAFVVRPFTLADLGSGIGITPSLALSNELDEGRREPSNAGVMLMHIPFLRHTMREFHSWILNLTSPDTEMGPSDQGAYLTFYRSVMDFLDPKFNVKPYWSSSSTWTGRFIIHFHGVKPHDIMNLWFNGACTPYMCFLLYNFKDQPYQCLSLQAFAVTALSEGPLLADAYCKASVSPHSDLCLGLLQNLGEAAVASGAGSCKVHAEAAIREKGLNVRDFNYLY